MIRYTNSDITDSVLSDGNNLAFRIQLGIIGARDSPFQNSEEICSTLTMEIWFQQVFNKKYRDINPVL